MDSRYEKYMQFVNGGSAVVPIQYIADVLGVTYTEAVCDLQEMAALGYLGSGAYVNYKEHTLVLKNFAASGNKTYANQNRNPNPGPNPNPRPARNVNQNNYAQYRSNSIKKMQNFGISKGKRVLMLIGGIFFLFLLGIPYTLDSLDMFFYSGFAGYWIPDVLQGLVFSGIGAFLLGYRYTDKKRSERMQKYSQIISGRDSIDIETLSEYSMTAENKVRRDLERMIRKNYLGPMAHISKDGMTLLLKYDDEKLKSKNQQKKEVKEETKVEDRYDAIIKEIRQLNDDIPDEAVSERIYKIEDITTKIFAIVKEHPEKENDIKTFMSYYLPTTLKLLRSYSVFEKQGIKGDNIDSTLKDIERILDTLVKGFTQQLDRMFQSDALDISSDIEVLESMMAQDGLSGGSAFASAKDADDDTQLKF